MIGKRRGSVMRLAVPAFFGLPQTFTDTTGQSRQCWPTMQAAGGAVRIAVAERSFPALAAGDPIARTAAQNQFQALRSNGMLVLGYAFSRTSGGATDPMLAFRCTASSGLLKGLLGS